MLARGAAAWNEWRADHDETPDLSRAGLRGLDLSGFDLTRADLRGIAPQIRENRPRSQHLFRVPQEGECARLQFVADNVNRLTPVHQRRNRAPET